MYGVRDGPGANATLQIDSGPLQHFGTATGDGSFQAKQLLVSQSGLDPSREHLVTITYDDSSYGGPSARKFLGLDYFEVETNSETTYVSIAAL